MSDINMTDNWRNNVNTTSINYLYQKIYLLIVLKLKSMFISFAENNVLTNRDVYNCTDECIRSKQLSGEYDIFRRTKNKTKKLFVMNVMNILKVLNLLYSEDMKYIIFL